MSDPAVPPVARVKMPEKGLYSVRFPGGLEIQRGVRVVVSLDYGLDMAEFREFSEYDPARDGPHPPGFSLVRIATPEDVATCAANEDRARVLRDAFHKAAQETVPDIKVPYARLSLGGSKLFVRYVCERQHPDFGNAISVMRKDFGVVVNAWQMGARDEVRVMGAMGACGRVCCCAAWQQKYPCGLAAESAKAKGQNPVGVCGMFKCCLAFERDV